MMNIMICNNNITDGNIIITPEWQNLDGDIVVDGNVVHGDIIINSLPKRGEMRIMNNLMHTSLLTDGEEERAYSVLNCSVVSRETNLYPAAWFVYHNFVSGHGVRTIDSVKKDLKNNTISELSFNIYNSGKMFDTPEGLSALKLINHCMKGLEDV